MSTGVQAVLLGILGFCTNFEWFLGTCMIQRPIVIGPFVGLIMGDFQAVIIMGATMELAFAGAASIGALTRRIWSAERFSAWRLPSKQGQDRRWR